MVPGVGDRGVVVTHAGCPVPGRGVTFGTSPRSDTGTTSDMKDGAGRQGVRGPDHTSSLMWDFGCPRTDAPKPVQ